MGWGCLEVRSCVNVVLGQRLDRLRDDPCSLPGGRRHALPTYIVTYHVHIAIFV